MALIVEDGTIVANANSYVSIVDIKAWASARGFNITSTDAEIETKVILAMDHFESYRNRFKGYKVNLSQSLQWPRYNVYIDGSSVGSNIIPVDVKMAICQLITDVLNGLELNNVSSESIEKKVKVDVIEVENYVGSGISGYVSLPKFEKLLSPLLKSEGFSLEVGRK